MSVKKVQKEDIRFLRNPITVKQMAEQIHRATDEYVAMQLSEKDLKELLFHYATHHGKKIFGFNGSINPTISKIIGKKRVELIKIMLAGYQITLI